MQGVGIFTEITVLYIIINILGAEDIMLLMLFNADNSLAAKFESKRRDWEDWNKVRKIRKMNKIFSYSALMTP